MKTFFILSALTMASLHFEWMHLQSAHAETTGSSGTYDDGIMRAARRIEYENSFLQRRNLVAMPMCSTPNNGPFGSFHYNPDSASTPPVDVYVNPDTSCAFQNVLQQWNDKFCPDTAAAPYEERGCRVSFGNISHRNTVNFPPHRTHRDGTCIDIRPMRRGGFQNAGLRWGNRNRTYDRAMTAEFLRLARANGASLMLFNDPAIRSNTRSSNHVPGVVYSGGHDDHMHICFDPRRLSEQQRTCPSSATPACGPSRPNSNTPFIGA